jgi:hypothetical protein
MSRTVVLAQTASHQTMTAQRAGVQMVENPNLILRERRNLPEPEPPNPRHPQPDENNLDPPDDQDPPNPDQNGNNDDPPDLPDPDLDEEEDEQDDAEQPNLARALNRMTDTFRGIKSQQSKVREPDPFDGTDSHKLQTWLVQCQLNFRDRPKTFDTDEAKVNYAVSYLKGTALKWAEPAILGEEDPPPVWLENWDEFTQELRDNFSPTDPSGDAENDIDMLAMKDNNQIAKYNIEFNCLSAQLRWDENSLHHKYYKGLPPRIKDEIAWIGKPDTLKQLRIVSQTIDARYWA